MKIRRSPCSDGIRPLRLSSAVVMLLVLPASVPAAATPAAPTRAPGKPYTLYLGADLFVEWQGKLWPVRGVRRDSFVIETEGQAVRIRDTDLRMKINRALKMATGYATISNLKAERAYTAANDPRHYAHDTMMAASVAADDLDISVYNLNRLESIAGRDAAAGHPSMVTQEMLAGAGATFQRGLADQGSMRYSVAGAISREQDELARKLFDAFQLSFDISSRDPLRDPYLVLIVRFRDKPDKPKTTRLLVYGQVLPAIDQRPQTVRLFRGGFPRGFELEDYQIHIYDHGTEVATSTAPNQMAMTRDEAFQYAMLDYVARNRDKTVAPAPSRAFWPGDLAGRLPTRTLNRHLYVKVGTDGRAAGFYEDQGCTRPIKDADLEAVQPDLFFQPALERGKPVDGVIEFNLGRRID